MKVLERIHEFARQHPDHPALVLDSGEDSADPDRSVSYGQLMQRTSEVAARLREGGVSKGDRCGIRGRSGAPFIEICLGVLDADACMVPIPQDTAGDALDRFALQARLHHLLDEDREYALQSHADAGCVDGHGDVDFRALAPAYLRYTSGTTHERKGVILGAAAIDERLEAANRGLEIGPEDRVLWLLPMAHHFVVSILLYLRHGATILLPESSLARPVLSFAERARATVVYASPHHYAQFAGDQSNYGLGSVRLAISTATGLRESVARSFAERFGFPVVQALGIIEVGLPLINRASAAEKPTALGRPLPDYQLRLVGDDGHEAADGSPGQLCIAGPGLFDAYLDPWTPAAAITAEVGFQTGDQARVDPDGDYHLEGRRANRISMAGMKFFAEEVEAVLDAHPAVSESRVRAVAHEQLGEFPAAEIIPADSEKPPSRRDLLGFCRARLPGYKIPRRFEVVASLPRTPTGKIQRWRPED
jgi:long-chain acyl-CoA synthetase